MNKTEMEQVYRQYEKRFGPVPLPVGIMLEDIMVVVAEHLRKGKRIPGNYNWFPGAPEDADL